MSDTQQLKSSKFVEQLCSATDMPIGTVNFPPARLNSCQTNMASGDTNDDIIISIVNRFNASGECYKV